MGHPSRQLTHAALVVCALSCGSCRRETFGGQATSYPLATAASASPPSSSAPSIPAPPKKGTPPRILLGEAALTRVVARASESRPEWIALERQCVGSSVAPVEWPEGQDYPPDGGIGEGYQGDGYYPAFMNLGLCYQVARVLSPERAAPFARKAVEILTKMSEPEGPHAVNPLRDDGFGIRHFGISLAIGYDWLRDELTPELRSRIVAALDRWISAYEKKGFGHDHPQGNYFAGYFATKCLAGLAVSGDDPRGDRWLADWRERLYAKLVQPYYAKHLAGGGWPEGWGYGGPGTFNMILPILAMKSALGVDLVADVHAPFPFAVDTALHLLQFSWPSRRTMEDRGMLYAAENPSALSLSVGDMVWSLLDQRGDPLAPAFHRFLREAKETKGARAAEPWQDALFWDPAAKEAELATQPRSFFAKGMSAVAMRSSWDKEAVWGAFTAGAYVGNPDSGEMYFDQGSFSIVRGARPFVVNPTGALVRHSAGTQDGGGGKEWDKIYADLFGNHDADPAQANRSLFNVLAFTGPRSGQIAAPLEETRTHVGRFEDRGAFVVARGEHLEDLYRKEGREKVVRSWTRQLVFLRPNLFVVDDRTDVRDVRDQLQAFHVGARPEAAKSSEAGSHRFDVGRDGQFLGTVTSLLPRDHTVATTDVFDRHKVFRIEIHPKTTDAAQRWLTVFDASSSPSDVALATVLSQAAGNVKKGAVVGAQLASSKGRFVVLAGAGGADDRVGGPISYVVGGPATHVVTDLTPGAGYAVTTSASGETTLVPGGSLVASATGVLAFVADAGGAITAITP